MQVDNLLEPSPSEGSVKSTLCGLLFALNLKLLAILSEVHYAGASSPGTVSYRRFPGCFLTPVSRFTGPQDLKKS